MSEKFRIGYNETKKFVTVDAASAEIAVHRFAREEFWAWDADSCGTDRYSVIAIDSRGDETFYNISHSWWIDCNPDWEILNQYEIEKVDESALNFPVVRDRDWLII